MTRMVARELHTRPRARNNFGNRGGYRRVRFRSCGTVGYGPTMCFFLIGAVTSCTVMVARHVREYHVSYVGNNVGTKGKGRREPFSCQMQRGGPIGKVLVHRWLPECHQHMCCQGQGKITTIFLLVATRRTNTQGSRPSVATGFA